MTTVRINGEDSGLSTAGLSRVTDVVELIKNTIDPDHMIVTILLDGRELDEEDWTAPISSVATSIFEIETGTPESFVASRMEIAPGILDSTLQAFQSSRESFKDGKMNEGNLRLKDAVTTLQAFFEWYTSMVNLVPEEQKADFDLGVELDDVVETCKKICQQQLYQSWWALGETLENELEPRLGQLLGLFQKRWASKAA